MYYFSPWIKSDADVISIFKRYTSIRKQIKKGSLLINQNDKVEYLYLLLEGKICVSTIHADGQEKILCISEPGSFIGEASFFDENITPINVIAMEDTVVLAFRREVVNKMIMENPKVSFILFNSMAKKIRLLTFQLDCQTFMNNQQRILTLLMIIFDALGVNCTDLGCAMRKNRQCKGGVVLSRSVTDTSIAQMLGIRREMVTKVISQLKAEGILRKNGRVLCCSDLYRIKEASEVCIE